jgi:hypothetical protein
MLDFSHSLLRGIASVERSNFWHRVPASTRINKNNAARMIQTLTRQRKDHAANIVD